MRQQPIRFGLALAWSILLASGPLVLYGMAGTNWYTLKANGKTVGKVEVRNWRNHHGKKGNITEIHNINHFTRDGNPFEMQTVSRFVESPVDGSPWQFQYQYQLGAQRFLDAQGQLEGDHLDLRLIQEDQEVQGQAPIQASRFLFPEGLGIQNIYRLHAADPPGKTFEFQTISLGIRPAIVDTQVTPLGNEVLALGDGGKKSLRKYEVKNAHLGSSKAYEWRDAKGKLYLAKSLGEDGLELSYASRRQARQASEATLDLVTSSAVVSNVIPQPRMTAEALYRISPINGQSLDWHKFFPDGYTQEVMQAPVSGLLQDATSNALYLRVTQKEPIDSAVPYPIAFDSKYLKTTPYVQSADPEIDHLALSIVGFDPKTKEARAYYAARRLQQWVYRNIAYKDLSLGFATAKETLRRRQGDCTEHAVLLAALTRALGIPSRVAIGLIYIPQGESQLGRFVYHMWNEVYIGDGQAGSWMPLDATNPEVTVDATHIKIADSALSDDTDLFNLTQTVAGLMGKMKIDTIKALSSAQSTLIVGKQSSGVLAAEIPEVDIQRLDIRTLSKAAIQRFRVALPPSSLETNTADGLFTYGMDALGKGQAEQAEQAFQKAMGKLHRPVEFYRMGEKLVGIEYYALARQAFEEAQRLDSRFGPLISAWLQTILPAQDLSAELNRRFLLAGSTLANGDAPLAARPDAISMLQTILGSHPDFAPAHRRLGELSQGTEAIEHFRHAVALQPQDFRNQEGLGDAWMAQGQYAAAETAYRAAFQLLARSPFSMSKPWVEDAQGKLALATGAALLEKDPKSASGWLSIGRGLALQNRSAEATVAFHNAQLLGSASARIEAFGMALKNDDWGQLFKTQSALVPATQSQALAALRDGQYYIRVRQYPQAVQLLKQAISLAPQHGEAYLALAQTYQRMALGQSPVMATSSQESARAVLRQGQATASSLVDRNKISLALARQCIQQSQPEEAIQLTSQVLTRNPMAGEAYFLQGWAQRVLNDLPAAQESLSTALILNPNDSETLLQLGHVANAQGREPLALSDYQKANQADPLNAEAARSYNELKAKLQLAGKAIPDYWYLNEDEHDFLVQLLYQFRQSRLNMRDYFTLLSALPGIPGQVEFSTRGISAIEKSRGVLESIYNREVVGYNRVRSWSVPPRFQALYSDFSEVSYGHKNLYEAASGTYLSFNTSLSALKPFLTRVDGVIQLEKNLARRMDELTHQLPEAAWKQLLLEAQATDLLSLEQDIARLSSGMSSQVGQAEAAQKKKSAAAANGASPPTKVEGASPETNEAAPKTDSKANSWKAPVAPKNGDVSAKPGEETKRP